MKPGKLRAKRRRDQKPFTKKTTIDKLADGQKFKLSKRSGAAIYSLESKTKGMVIYTSLASGRTYPGSLKTIVFIKCPENEKD